jgi:diamine N-acetyltransferase
MGSRAQMMIRIKKAAFTDAAIISVLGKQTFQETFRDLFTADELNEYLENTFGIKKLEDSLLRPWNIFGIVYYSDMPVGYYKVKIGSGYDDPEVNNPVQLQKIYVLKDYLDKKLGKALLEDIFALQEIKACDMIWLVVLHSNGRAIRFYENNGFGKLKKYYHRIGAHDLEYDLMTRAITGS